MTQRAFAANSGRPTDIDSTHEKDDNTTVLQDNAYQWQSNGQLQSRISHVGSMNARKEDFVYDHLNWLTSAKTFLNGGTSASRTLETTYDKLGNIETKTSSVTADVDVTGYGYGSGTTAPGHHAVTSASIGGNAYTFSYDADGNMTQYNCTSATCEDKYIGWNKRNLPTTVTLGDSLADTTPTAKDEFAYGPIGQRYYKKSTWDDAGTERTEHTFYVGRFEEVLPGDQPDYSSIQKTRVTDSLLHVRTTAAVGGAKVSAMEYLHRDHLGSVEAVTDAEGASLLVQAYDPFGERRKKDWTGMLSASEQQTLADNQPLQTSRGYTGHEHLDRTGFIHMNGRLYDPQLGRFLSPDPIVAAPGSSQSWNSYSYVSNSPLSFVDPGGQFQAGVGCNVGYVMCMNGGGNTSGRGGGGSSQGTETVPIRTFNFHIGVSFARVPVLRDPIGSIFGRGGDINDDPNGGINSDVYFGGLPSFRVISNFFISITSNTETRQIQTTEEEQSPASRPMGAGAQKGIFADHFQNITGMTIQDSISLYKAQTGEILTAIQVEKLFTDPEYARKQILASENLHKVYRGILNSNAPLTIAAAKERGFVQLKVIQSYFHNPWYNPWQNSKWIGPSGHLERVFDGQGNVILSNDYMGTFNFFGPNQTSNHWNADVVPFNKWGN